MLIMVISSCYTEPFINILCPSFSLVSFLHLKSILSEIIIVVPFFWLLLAWNIFLAGVPVAQMKDSSNCAALEPQQAAMFPDPSLGC